MRIVKCVICGSDFKTSQKGIVKTCGLACRKTMTKRNATAYAAKKRGTGLEGNGEVYFGNAKEPLMKTGGGFFGYLGVLTYSKDRDKVQCHVCGKFYRALSVSGHLKVHEMTNDEYKEEFEIARTVALVSEGTREKQLTNFLERKDDWRFDIKDAMTDEQRRKTNKGKKRRIYTRNKTGHCPLQLLEPIKKLHAKLGKVPNGEDFRREYGRKYISTILQIYGSYAQAVKVAGFVPREGNPQKYQERELLEFLRNFYKKHHRTPANSDFKRGYLPLAKHYIKRFGSLNRARAMANIPLMLQIAGWRWKQVPLTKKLKRSLSVA